MFVVLMSFARFESCVGENHGLEQMVMKIVAVWGLGFLVRMLVDSMDKDYV